MLSLLIPGQKGPGNDIDVYLQLLVDELKQLWEVGVTTFDSLENKISICVQQFDGQLMTSQHIRIFLDGILWVLWLVLLVIMKPILLI